MNSKKIRKRNSIMAVLFVSVLLITLLFTQTTANAGTATSIVKNKTFYIENCGTNSWLQFYCQADKNDSLSGYLQPKITASAASSSSGKTVIWRLPKDNTALGGSITCYYISSEKKWKIVMTNVNCFTYTPYIYCYAGKIPGKYAAGVISTGTNGNGITANGTYSSVNQTPEFQNNNNFRFYIGAGFDDAGFRFSWGNNQYTMKLNANGGTMPSTYPSSGLKMVYNSTNYYALGYIPTRRGYVFNGYYSAASGGSQVYLSSGACNTNNATYWSKDKKFMYAPPTGNNTTFTLYAHWTPKTYTLKLNGNGGTVPSSYPSSGLKLTYASTNYSSVSSYTPTREGYTFDGWYNSTSGGTKIYNANGSCVTGTTYFNANKQCQYDTTNGATINAYAHWTPKSYTITTKHLKYNPMTNEWDEWKTTTESAKYDTTYEVKHITADTGYVTFSKDASFVVKGKKTVNAFYYPKQYNVTLDYAGGVDKDNNTKTDDVVNWTYASDNGTDLSKYALTKEGYTFKGWYIDDTLVYDTTNKAVTSEYFKNNLCILNSANGSSYQLTAKWEANPYKINLDYNYKDLGFADETEANLLVNGTNTIIDYIDVTYNEKIGDLPNPSILGASFVGWNTKADKTGDTYTKDTVYTIADDVTLYAIWEVNDFTITYNSNYAEDFNNISYEVKGLSPIDNIIINGCCYKDNTKEYTFGAKAGANCWLGKDNEYCDVPEGDYYYVSGNNYYRFVGFSVDSKAQHTNNKILLFSEDEIKGYDLQYLAKAVENTKDSLTDDVASREEVIISEYTRLKEANAYVGDANVTLYAVWDKYPVLSIKPEVLLLEDIKKMTVEEFTEKIASFIDAEGTFDKEDGLYTDNKMQVTFPYIENELKAMQNFKSTGGASVTVVLTDTYGNTTTFVKLISFVKGEAEDISDPTIPRDLKIVYYSRAINEFYYNKKASIVNAGGIYDKDTARRTGGLEPNSKWYINPDYVKTITNTFKVLREDKGYIQIWKITPQKRLEMQEYISEHGIGNSKEPDALKNFYNQFSDCIVEGKDNLK